MSKIWEVEVINEEATPDPATFCAAEGYIPNPITYEWELIAEFQTNSPSTTTFDPYLQSATSNYLWDVGDGSLYFFQKAFGHTYLDNSTKTVKLYKKEVNNITYIDFTGDNIIGIVDLTNESFNACTGFLFPTNSQMTQILLPNSSTTGLLVSVSLGGTGISGVFDLSNYTSFNSTDIYLTNLPNITSVIFAPIITGTIHYLRLYNCNITGTLDLSGISATTANCEIELYGNTSLTSVIFSSTVITGTISKLTIQNTAISSLNLNSFRFTSISTIYAYVCPNLMSITFNSANQGFSSIYLYECNLIGTLDLSMFTTLGIGASVFVQFNYSLTNIIFANTITGSITSLSLGATGLTGTLDLSMFTTLATSNVFFTLSNNPSLTSVIFYNGTITGNITGLSITNCNLTGILDISKFINWSTSYSSTSLNLNNNVNLTSILFPTVNITGGIRMINIYNCTSLGYINLTKLNTSINSINWQLQSNNWTVDIVNHILVDIDGISITGYTGRVITIGGTNADPDSSSGGYDGIAARNSLIAKGFTVTIT